MCTLRKEILQKMLWLQRPNFLGCSYLRVIWILIQLCDSTTGSPYLIVCCGQLNKNDFSCRRNSLMWLLCCLRGHCNRLFHELVTNIWGWPWHCDVIGHMPIWYSRFCRNRIANESVSNHCRDNGLQTYWGHDMTLQGHVTSSDTWPVD